jgi:hypothetical protein
MLTLKGRMATVFADDNNRSKPGALKICFPDSICAKLQATVK